MRKFGKPGFTLVEAIMTIAIFSLLAYGIIGLVSNVLLGGNRQQLLLAGSDQARKIAFNIMRELRNATTSNVGAYPIEQAGSQQLVFYSNADTDPDLERINYYLLNNKLYRGIINPSGNPLTYNPATEQVTVVQNDVANGARPLFNYYDGSYNGVSENPLSQPVNVTQVKYVKVTLYVTNRGGLTSQNSFFVTTGGTIRNLKTNLGN